MMDGFMQLVKDMRAAQKEYFAVLKNTANYAESQKWAAEHDALQRSKALERRVDEEIAAAEL